MTDITSSSPGPEQRAESTSTNSSSPPLTTTFMPINLGAHGEPRRLRHVTREAMQEHTAAGTIGEDNGPEPGFKDRPHGTDFWEDDFIPDDANNQDALAISEKEEQETEEQEEEGDADGETYAPGAEARVPGISVVRKRKRVPPGGSAPAATETQAENTPTVEVKRGRKVGAPRKETPRPWTDAECVALLQVYVKNPKATHKAVAALHHADFWRGDAEWEGRTFSACQQRLIALNSKSRDRNRLPGVLAKMQGILKTADDTEGVDGETEGQDAGQVNEAVDEHVVLEHEVNGEQSVFAVVNSAEPADEEPLTEKGKEHIALKENLADVSDGGRATGREDITATWYDFNDRVGVEG